MGCSKIRILVNSKIELMSTKEQISEELLIEEETVRQNEIVVFNDDVNTFDHVIRL